MHGAMSMGIPENYAKLSKHQAMADSMEVG